MKLIALLAMCLTLLGRTSFMATSHQESGSKVIVNYPKVDETAGGDAVELSLYFTLVDASNRPYAADQARITRAEIVLDDGTRYPANVALPDAPIYLVLVLDASGSMSPAMNDLKQAARQFVEQTPSSAHLALLGFNESITTRRNFTQSRDDIYAGIGEIQSVPDAGTCLYDATYEAVQMLADQPQNRRAVVLFTDGRDVVLSGEPCSEHQYDEIVALAKNPGFQVPIHMIGMVTDSLDRDTVESLATATGGLWAIGEQAELGTLFRQVVAGLNNQWLATASLDGLEAGEYTARLEVTVNDSVQLVAEAVTFEVTGAQRPTATPTPVIAIRELTHQIDSVNQQIIFDFTVEGSEYLHSYRVEFVKDNQVALAGFEEVAPGAHGTIAVSGEGLKTGRYEVTVYGLDIDRRVRAYTVTTVVYNEPTITPSPTPTASLTATATSTPSPTQTLIAVAINDFRIDETDQEFILAASIVGEEAINSYRLEFLDASRQVKWRGEYYAHPERIPFTEAALAAGRYAVILFALDQNGQTLARAESTITHNPPPNVSPTPLRPTISFDAQPGPSGQLWDYVLAVTVEPLEAVSLIRSYGVGIYSERTSVRERFAEYGPETALPLSFEGLPSGNYTVRLVAVGDDGRELARAEGRIAFLLPTDTPTPTLTPTATLTLTPTPPIIIVEIDSIEVDEAQPTELYLLLDVTGWEYVWKYRVELRKGIRLIGDAEYDPPGDDVLPFSLGDVGPGDYTIKVIALDSNGMRLAESEPVSYQITPTPTPSPSPTPVIAVEFTLQKSETNPWEYNLLLTAQGREFIHNYRVDVFSPGGMLVKRVEYAPQDTLTLSLEGQAQGTYTVRLIALDEQGRELTRFEGPLEHTLPPTETPTPTPTETPTVTPTPAPVVNNIGVEPDPDKPGDLILTLDVTGTENVYGYRVEVTDRNSGLKQRTLELEPPADNKVPLSMTGIEAGQYNIRVIPLSEDRRPAGQPGEVAISYTPPPPPITPSPEPTLTPTVAPTPTPVGPVEQVRLWVSENPAAILLLVVVFVAAVAALVMLLHGSRKPQPVPGYIDPLTGAVGGAQQGPSLVPPTPSLDGERTNPEPWVVVPRAYVIVRESPDKNVEGRTFEVKKTPFRIGRKGADLDLLIGGDDRVSRQHAEIRYENGRFMLYDKSSLHGTILNNMRITAPTPLPSGAQVGFGPATKVEFHVEESGFDADKTNPALF